MKGLVAIAALLVIAFAPHAEATLRPSATSASDSILRLTADSDAASDRDSFTRQAMDAMREWQRKLRDASTTAAAKGKAASAAAEKDLHQAWADAEAASHRPLAAGVTPLRRRPKPDVGPSRRRRWPLCLWLRRSCWRHAA